MPPSRSGSFQAFLDLLNTPPDSELSAGLQVRELDALLQALPDGVGSSIGEWGAHHRLMHLHLTLPSEPDRPSSGEGIARRAYYGSIEILCDVASTIRARRAPPLSRSVLYACICQRYWRKCCVPPGSC
jgi:hypothetical protein